MNLVDDATGRTLARLGDEETIWAAADLLRCNHGTHQDRLVKKLRRWGIADAGGANAFLATTYLPEHHDRFAHAPASAADSHRRTPGRAALDRAFQLEDTRVLSNDWVIRYDTRYLQVARQSHQVPARSTVTVREAVTGAIEIRCRGRLMRWCRGHFYFALTTARRLLDSSIACD